MSGVVMNEFRLVYLALLAALAACSAGGDPPPNAEPPLAGARMGGAFELTSEDGETVRDTDFEGQYRLIYFGYTFCPDVCPIDMQKLGQGMRALEASNPDLAGRIQPIFISVDPDRDTPEVLQQFTDSFHPRLLGLTGPADVLDEIVPRYGSYYSLGEDDGSGRYLVDHSNNVVLYGPEGEPLAAIDMDASGEDIAAEIERWAS